MWPRKTNTQPRRHRRGKTRSCSHPVCSPDKVIAQSEQRGLRAKMQTAAAEPDHGGRGDTAWGRGAGGARAAPRRKQRLVGSHSAFSQTDTRRRSAETAESRPRDRKQTEPGRARSGLRPRRAPRPPPRVRKAGKGRSAGTSLSRPHPPLGHWALPVAPGERSLLPRSPLGDKVTTRLRGARILS